MEPNHTHTLPIKKVFEDFGTSEQGLVPKEAQLRLTRYGPNVLFEEKRFRMLKLFLAQFKNFFVLLLILASALSFAFESAANGTILLVVVVLNISVSFIQERKAEKTLESLRKIYPTRVEVIRGGKVAEVAVEELVVGDVVVLREGEAVPADLRIFEVEDLTIDEAALTGESVPSIKVIKEFPSQISLADRENMAYTGTSVVSGMGHGVVVRTGLETEFGRIAAFVQEEEGRSLLLDRIAHLGAWLTAISAALALLILGLGFLRGVELIHSVNFAIAAFVSAVPESLPTVTTLALAVTALKLSRRKALVRHLPTVEALSGINLFAFDKTGTLTLNEMSVARIVLGEREFEVTGTGFSSEGEILEGDRKVEMEEDPRLRRFIEVGSRAVAASISPSDGEGESRWVVRGDPTEGAFLVLSQKVGLPLGGVKMVEDFAFTSQRRMRSRVLEEGRGAAVYSLGAPEIILAHASRYLKDGKGADLSPKARGQIKKQAQKLASEGYRVLALATKQTKKSSLSREKVEDGLTFVGLAGLLDKPKKRVAETFSALVAAGIKPIIITGDHPQTTQAVAKSLGLTVSEEAVLSGEEMDRASDEELLGIIPHIVIYARITPTQKYRLVKLFKRSGLRVAVSGDGVNDAPALKKADVGVVMGERGTDVSKEAADLVILDDKIETVLPAIAEARTLYDNIKKFFTFLLSGNFEELLIIAAALLLGLPRPFTMIQILWINLITDAFPAFALAYDPPEEDILHSRPRDLSPRMIRPILLYALFLGFISLVGESVLFLSYLPNEVLARTMIFTGAVLFELFIVFSIRTRHPLWRGIFSNRYLLIAFAGSFLLQLAVIYFAPLRRVMGTVALGVNDWLAMAGFIAVSLILVESAKWIVRQRA